MKKQYNIYDIARELEMSPSTVSKAINNYDLVSQKTKDKVKAFIKEKGYTPNIVASSLKNKVSLSIGVAYPTTTKNVMTHFFFSHVIESFREYVENAGYEFCYVSHHLGKYVVTYEQYCTQRSLDGVLILGATSNDKEVMDILECGCKVVSLDYLDDNIPFVQTDDTLGAKLIIEHLEKNDLNKIGYISGPYNLGEFYKRTSVFKENLKSSNITLKEEDIIEINGTDYDAGFNGAVKLLLNSKVDAVVVSNDEIAFGAIRGIESLGYKVPNDISVIGFDDMFFSKYYTPALTTIRQDVASIGRIAGETLINLLNDKEVKKENLVPCKLIVRNSTKNK